ncbi:putative F-box protein At1g19160 [Triticum aestivum]|uniref:putative F-box protein At1g19160 n=1 Tax=Triticum aestivum TaxID=4565 RepID=UPI001D006AB5|nr:putative F-box protein At1g19160 [Triticum aestivum]
MTTTILTDDLVVEILSRLPLKSFCRFKCVSKSWLAFSSDLHYRQKLPRTPVGLLYQKREHDTAIHLAGLPSSDRDIDTTLSFVPCTKHPLELKYCSNGLVLCYHGGMSSKEISDAIVCNPATQEWMTLPDTEPGPAVSYAHLNTSMSSNLSQAQAQMVDMTLKLRTFRLPGFPYGPDQRFYCFDGRLCQSSGVLCYAQQESDGCMIQIWSLEGSDRWVVKRRLSMNNVFGRDIMLRTSNDGFWYFDYEILAFDLERELVILADTIANNKIISYSISTGKVCQILNIPRFIDLYRSLLYVPYYGKFPASVFHGAQDKC